MKKSDLFLFIGFLAVIAAMIIFAYYSYTNNVNECTSDPIRYGVEQIKENYNATYVRGTIEVTVDGKFKTWNFGDEYTLIDLYLS